MKIPVSKVSHPLHGCNFPTNPSIYYSQTLMQCHQPVSNRISRLLTSPHNTWLCELSFALMGPSTQSHSAGQPKCLQLDSTRSQQLS